MIDQIISLAEKLPSGIPDPDAPEKLVAEMCELADAISAADLEGALTEAADIGYYAVKCLHLAVYRINDMSGSGGLTPEGVLSLTVAKYVLRARPGNPKDDGAERKAVWREWIHQQDIPFCGEPVAPQGDGYESEEAQYGIQLPF